MVYTTAVRLLGRPADAEDVAETVFVGPATLLDTGPAGIAQPPIPPSPTARPVMACPAGRGRRDMAGRKAGAAVVLHDGALVLYLERGGRTMLTSERRR